MEDLRGRLLEIFVDNQITGFPHDDSVAYPDLFDAHVHSAAVHAGISMIVTESAPAEIDSVILRQHAYRSSLHKPFNLSTRLRAAHCATLADYVGARLRRLL